jgi:ABC-type branched-subunit amino acid transport system ATPase component
MSSGFELDRYQLDRYQLDVAQHQAVAEALASPGPFAILGPPGTGKTTVIAEVIRGLCGAVSGCCSSRQRRLLSMMYYAELVAPQAQRT